MRKGGDKLRLANLIFKIAGPFCILLYSETNIVKSSSAKTLIIITSFPLTFMLMMTSGRSAELMADIRAVIPSLTTVQSVCNNSEVVFFFKF